MGNINWESLPGLMSLRQAADRLIEDGMVRSSRLASILSESPVVPIDMYQIADKVVLRAALPGIEPSELDITISGDTLHIRGEIKPDTELPREDYLHHECRYGDFDRSIVLPAGLKSEEAKATFRNGILTLTIPKIEEAKPVQIKIQVKGVTDSD